MIQKFKQLPRAEQRALYRKCVFRAFKQWPTWFAFFLMILFTVVGALVGEKFNFKYGIFDFGFLIGLCIGIIIFHLFFRRQILKILTEVL